MLFRGHTDSGGTDKYQAVAAISTGASESVTSGHFYWHYLGLVHNRQIPRNVNFRLVGNQTLTDASAVPLFSERAHRRRFKVGASTIIDYRFLSVRKVLGELDVRQSRSFYIYEGSLADLALILYLAPRMPDSVFVFNFFWPLDWRRIIERGQWIRSLLERLIRTSSRNIRFTADTPKFAEYLSDKLNYEFGVWPAFSPFKFPHRAENRCTSFDLLVAFKRPEELDFALQVIDQAAKERKLNVAVQGPTTGLGAGVRSVENPRCSFTFFGGDLDHDRYVDLLMSSNVVFLPYLKSHYEFGSSGKAMDAYQAGCATLIPEGSGIHSQAVKLGLKAVHTFSAGDTAGIPETILKIIDVPRRGEGKSVDFSRLLDYLLEFQESYDGDRIAGHRSRRKCDLSWAVLLAAGALNQLLSTSGFRQHTTSFQAFRRQILKSGTYSGS